MYLFEYNVNYHFDDTGLHNYLVKVDFSLLCIQSCACFSIGRGTICVYLDDKNTVTVITWIIFLL